MAGKDLNKAHFQHDLGAALLFFGVVLAAWLFLPIGFEFNPDHPDFNPLNIALLFFLGMGGWRLFKAWGAWSRMQRQGRLTIALEPPGEVRRGGVLRGRIVAERPLAVVGEVRVALQYMETHRVTEVGESDGRNHSREFMVWEDAFKSSVPSPCEAVPFEFKVPVGVGERGGQKRRSGHTTSVGFINGPGKTSRLTGNPGEPEHRRWLVEISGQLDNGKLFAEFELPWESR